MFQITHRVEQILVEVVYPRHELMTSNHSQCLSTLASFPSDKFLRHLNKRHLNKRRRSVSPCKLSEQNFETFTIRGRFSKTNRKNFSQNFQVLPLQTVITTQWLQIAGNLRPHWPSTGWLVSIFTARINPKSFPVLHAPYKQHTHAKFSTTSVTLSLLYRTS